MHYRTWIEVDSRALRHNFLQFRKLLKPETQFMAVIKSNAYGHGLVHVAKLLSDLQPINYYLKPSKLWFGVDSIVEALRLRKEGIKNRILVLGYTLPDRVKEAEEHNIALSAATFEALHQIKKYRPSFHIKVDSGMHRQGFLPHQTSELIKLIKLFKLTPEGIFTHFASAKDIRDPKYTQQQIFNFERVLQEFQQAGFASLIRHAAATGGTMLFPESHFDMVRVGMGLYGYWPAPESKLSPLKNTFRLQPVLSWKTIIGEIKEIPKKSPVGYDLTSYTKRKTRIAILPIGYWHGYDRGLSGIGEVLVGGKRAKILGRISMDMIVIDITKIPRARIGSEVVLVGKQGKEELFAEELASKISTSPYEFLTRLNPLIKRVEHI